MEAADALQTFAEISVGVVGFSAVVVAISPTVVVRDGRRLSWGMAILFGWGLAALFFSALPFILFYLGVPEFVIWRAGLLAAGIWFPVPGVYLSGMTVMLALSLWVLMVFYFLSELLAGRHRKPREP